MAIETKHGSDKIIAKTFSAEQIERAKRNGSALCLACGVEVRIGDMDPRMIICRCGLDWLHTPGGN